jgi:hypothetical protein
MFTQCLIRTQDGYHTAMARVLERTYGKSLPELVAEWDEGTRLSVQKAPPIL